MKIVVLRCTVNVLKSCVESTVRQTSIYYRSGKQERNRFLFHGKGKLIYSTPRHCSIEKLSINKLY